MNPHLFVLTQSQNNLFFCDKYLSARYITKYAAGMEEKVRALLTAGSEQNQLRVSVGEMENSKNSAAQHRQENDIDNQRKEAFQTEHLCIIECYWHLFDLPFVKSSFTSVCLNTLEMESRPDVKVPQLTKKDDGCR